MAVQRMLITQAQRERLIANFELNKHRSENPIDFKPVVKLFFPAGSGTWLLTELNPSNNVAFGLAHIHESELGYIDLTELASVMIRGLKVERDLYFKGTKPISKYAEEAREKGYIAA